MDKINPVCLQIQQINFEGNIDIIHRNWYKHLKLKDGKPDIVTMIILADIIYWYKLSEIRDQHTGETVGYKQRFREDKLQRSYSDYEKTFGFTKLQSKRATDKLQQLGLIKKEFRTITYGNRKINNVLYIEPVPEMVNHITNSNIPIPSLLISEQGIISKTLATNIGLNTNTDTTTDSTLESKDSFSVSENRNSENNNQTFGSNNNSTATELRNKAKTLDLQPVKKTYQQCPDKIQPYLDCWTKYTTKKFRGFNKTYEDSWKAIQEAVLGKFFTESNTPTVDNKYYGYKLTLNSWEKAVQNFSIRRNNADYYPEHKGNISKITPDQFLYFKKSQMKMKSYFVICTENEPKLLSSAIKPKPLNDPTPHYTNFLINILKEKLEWDLDNGNRAKAIDAVTKLNSTFERLEPKIINYGYFCGDFYKRAKLLVEMFESHQDRGIPIRPEYINTDKTHSIFIPEYMERVGLIKS